MKLLEAVDPSGRSGRLGRSGRAARASGWGPPLAEFLERAPLCDSLVLHLAVTPSSGAATEQRTRQHLAGRRALARVMNEVGIQQDPFDVPMPHPHLSISHSRDTVAALGTRGPGPGGVGVDIEHIRDVDARAARFFLCEDERTSWLPTVGPAAGAPGPARALLQLWTIKEAVFKADLRNRDQQLIDYRITVLRTRPGGPPGRRTITYGAARRGRAAYVFASTVVDDLIVTVAHAKSPIPEEVSDDWIQ